MAKQRTINVDFGNVGVGKGTARLSVRMSREGFDLEDAEHLFCGARLRATLAVTGGEQPLVPDALPKLTSIVDAKRLSLSPGEISTSLTFAKGEVNLTELSAFAATKGQLTVERIGDAVDAEPEAD